ESGTLKRLHASMTPETFFSVPQASRRLPMEPRRLQSCFARRTALIEVLATIAESARIEAYPHWTTWNQSIDKIRIDYRVLSSPLGVPRTPRRASRIRLSGTNVERLQAAFVEPL